MLVTRLGYHVRLYDQRNQINRKGIAPTLLLLLTLLLRYIQTTKVYGYFVSAVVYHVYGVHNKSLKYCSAVNLLSNYTVNT